MLPRILSISLHYRSSKEPYMISQDITPVISLDSVQVAANKCEQFYPQRILLKVSQQPAGDLSTSLLRLLDENLQKEKKQTNINAPLFIPLWYFLNLIR